MSLLRSIALHVALVCVIPSAAANAKPGPALYDAALRDADAAFKKKDYDQAFRLYEAAAKLDPAKAKPYYMRGQILRLKGDRQGAIRFYSQYLANWPNGLRTADARRFRDKLAAAQAEEERQKRENAAPHEPVPQGGQQLAEQAEAARPTEPKQPETTQHAQEDPARQTNLSPQVKEPMAQPEAGKQANTPTAGVPEGEHQTELADGVAKRSRDEKRPAEETPSTRSRDEDSTAGRNAHSRQLKVAGLVVLAGGLAGVAGSIGLGAAAQERANRLRALESADEPYDPRVDDERIRFQSAFVGSLVAGGGIAAIGALLWGLHLRQAATRQPQAIQIRPAVDRDRAEFVVSGVF